MDLITFTQDTLPASRRVPATIRFSRKSASALSKGFCLLGNFAAGDQIGIHQDKENPEDWYVSFAADGFVLRDYGSKGGGLLFNNSTMANTLLDYLEIEADSASFPIGKEAKVEDEVSYWPIITKKPIFKNKD